MSSKNQIFIDGRTAVHTGSKGRVDAWQMYRQGNAVVPRMNVSKTADAVSTSTTVSFFDCPAITTAAHIAKSQGDEDTEGGLLNGSLKGEATFFKTGSTQLLIEGHEAVRAFDLCEPNRGNGPLMPVMQVGGAPSGGAVPRLKLTDQEADAAPEEELSNWLLEIDKVPAYTQKDRDAWPALGQDWASYCPIPLALSPTVMRQNDKKIEMNCISVYPVSQDKKPLPSGWLYLFIGKHLWREFKITTVSQGMPLYHFSEVNLITQQGRQWREASTQGRMDTILLPRQIQGKAISMGVAFSETQWPWARVLSAGGMHPADPRLLPHRQQPASDAQFAQSEDKPDRPCIQSVTNYPTATLHTEAASPYAVYEGPLLLVSV